MGQTGFSMTPEGKAVTQRVFPLRDGMLGGVETTLPAHLLQKGEWRTQHNFRLAPTITQIPPKVQYGSSTIAADEILWLGMVPQQPGYGKVMALTPSKLVDLTGVTYTDLIAWPPAYRRWAVAIYDGVLYYCNELNGVRKNDGTRDDEIIGAPRGRYLTFWYDHMVIGYPIFPAEASKAVYYPNRVMISALGFFSDVTMNLSGGETILPAWGYSTNKTDATYYDFLEWQQTDYPYTGITGLGKLRGALWVYTPTAIIPMSYVGLPKVIKVEDSAIITRTGNTFPWTLVCLDQVHMFYDGIENMFWAFDGSLTPIGEPIRGYIKEHLNTDPELAQRMYGYVDVENREVWWPFVSTASTGDFDLAVVFNYRLKKWYTASVENVQSFVGATRTIADVTTMGGTVGDSAGLVSAFGLGLEETGRLYGTDAGVLLRDVLVGDDPANFLTYDTPTLESPDYHYGDVRTTKENDLMVINATLGAGLATGANVGVEVVGRDYLGDAGTFASVGSWLPTLPDGLLSYASKVGRVFRYRFKFNGTQQATFAAFSESVYQKRAEK